MSISPDVKDLTTTLDRHRNFLPQTAAGLTEEQARLASTSSALTIASILKHVADTEELWMEFAQRGAEAFSQMFTANVDWSAMGPDAVDPRFVLSETDTLPALRERVHSVGARTSRMLEQLNLDSSHALPDAPWFEQGVEWSVRRVALHLLAEIAQHAGHADIIREAIDGAQTMG